VKIVVFFSGSGTNLRSIVDGQTKYNYQVIAALTNNPQAEGIKFCHEHKIDLKIINHNDYSEREKFDEKINIFLEEIDPDFVILAGFMRILGNSIINNWEGQIINIHPSLLPKYPGLNTHKRALNAGDKVHGTTIHYVTSELDCGPIIRQEQIDIEPNDNENTLMKRIKKIENLIYPEEISKLKI